MLNLLHYKPKEQFFWLRLTRRCCIVRTTSGRDETNAIIIANAPCLIDTLQDRVTPTDIHTYINASQTINLYIPRRFVHLTTGEEITIPTAYESGDQNLSGPAPQDIALVTGIPNPLIIEAVSIPLFLGSHFEITCSIDPRRPFNPTPDTADLWYGLAKPDAINDMLPFVTPLLPLILQI